MDGGRWHWQQFDQMTGDGSRHWSFTQSLTLSPWLLHSQGYWLSHQQGDWCQRLTNGKMQVFLYTWLFGFFFKWRCYIINTEYKGLLLHVHSHSSIMYFLPLIIRDFSSYACDQSAKIFTFLHVFFFLTQELYVMLMCGKFCCQNPKTPLGHCISFLLTEGT